MKKKLFKIGFLALAAVTFIGGLFALPANADGPRDCDSNAIIYCGTWSKTELYNKINNGTGRQYQSSYDLKYVYGKYGINTGQFEHLVNGRVTKWNEVYVGDTRVATNVYSTGRHATANSIREPWAVAYPIYRRHPSESFLSNSIDAYVYMNYDGTMAYAIIKSCGNIVPGVGVRVAPAPAPAYRLYAYKFIDANSNGRWDTGERPQSGVTFRLTGNGVSARNAVTGTDGFAGFYGLPAGTYTITEYVPTGYHATTANPQSVRVSADRQIVRFGNARNAAPVQTTSIQVVKYNDVNANRRQDSGERLLSGWQFRVTGNGRTWTLTTDSNGQRTLTGLPLGRYTVTEINQAGWENTTGLSITRNVTTDPTTQRFVYGNRLAPVRTVQLQVVKYEDVNGNRTQDNEENTLSGWQFRVVGNGRTYNVVTDVNGQVMVPNLTAGRYTVTEINQNGWESTTGLTQAHDVTTNPTTQRFIFGNRRLVNPPTPTPGGDVAQPLPKSGPGEAAATAGATTTLFSGIFAWLKSKKRLLLALRK